MGDADVSAAIREIRKKDNEKNRKIFKKTMEKGWKYFIPIGESFWRDIANSDEL